MKSTKENETIQVTKLLNGYYVPTDFYEEIRAVVGVGLNGVKPTNLYTCRDLCGEDFWSVLSKIEKWFAGRCLAHLVVNKAFNLEFVQYKRSPTKHYRLI